MRLKILMISLSMVLAQNANADIAIIVNPSNSAVWEGDVQSYVKDLFLNTKEKFPNGISAKPVDQNEGKSIRHDFYLKIANKDETGMNVYWSNLIFTGNGRTPKVIGDDNNVKRFVSENPNGIGYIDASQVDKSVKVIYTLK